MTFEMFFQLLMAGFLVGVCVWLWAGAFRLQRKWEDLSKW